MLKIFKQYYPIRNIFFVIGEGLLILLAVILTELIFLGVQGMIQDRLLPLKIILVAVICQSSLYYNDLYDLKVTKTYQDLGIRLTQSLGGAAIVLALIYTIFPQTIIGSGIFIFSTGLIVLFIASWRFGYQLILNRRLFNEKIILLGSGQMARTIVHEIINTQDSGYTVQVVVSDKNPGEFPNGPQFVHSEGYTGLSDIAKENDIKKIVVALGEKRGRFPTKELLACRVSGIDVVEGTTFYEMLTGKIIVEQIKPAWLIFSKGFHKSLSRRVFKRLVDLGLSVVMFSVLSPLLLVIVLLIKLDSRGPVLFSQDRVGENRRQYRVYKFRSMVADAEKATGPVWAQDDDPRVTRVGKYLRKLRIDELPQLWNVLKGEMSFVGPRPERDFFVKKLEAVIPFYGERFSVKPGVTGWAQVSYRYGASVDDAVEKLNYDLFYIKNMSIFMDIVIIFKTIKIVLFGKGAR